MRKSMSIFDPIEEGDAPFSSEPSAYDLHVAQARQERQLRQQIRKHGDEAMRVEPKVEVGSDALSTEPFERSYVIRMAGSSAPRADSKDPLKSLLKAMNISGSKRQPVQSSGNKDQRGIGNEEQRHGSGLEFKGSGRPPRGHTNPQPAEIESRDAA
jgi:hypothetical protein